MVIRQEWKDAKKSMTVEDILVALSPWSFSVAKCPRRAVFDGIELHGANRLPVETKFLSTYFNRATIAYGGSPGKTACAIVVETIKGHPAQWVGSDLSWVFLVSGKQSPNPDSIALRGEAGFRRIARQCADAVLTLCIPPKRRLCAAQPFIEGKSPLPMWLLKSPKKKRV